MPTHPSLKAFGGTRCTLHITHEKEEFYIREPEPDAPGWEECLAGAAQEGLELIAPELYGCTGGEPQDDGSAHWHLQYTEAALAAMDDDEEVALVG